MAGPRAEKVAVVDEVKDHFERADAAILTEYRGLKVADLAALRRQLTGAGAQYKIYKNTLVRRATAGTAQEVMDALLVGPTAIAFVNDDVATVAKVLREFARTHPALVVKGSFVGTDLLDAANTNALADLPSRDQLLAQIAGALAAPMRQFAGLLKALPQNFAYGLQALVDQRVAGGEALPAPALDVGDVADVGDAVVVPDAEHTASGAETGSGSDTTASDSSADTTASDSTPGDSIAESADSAPVVTEEPAADEPAADEPATESSAAADAEAPTAAEPDEATAEAEAESPAEDSAE